MDSILVLLIFLILLSGAFSGAEIALTSLSPAKVRTFEGDKKMGSTAIVKLKRKPHNLIITILIGNNIVNILATVLATLWGVQTFGNAAIGIVTGVLTFVILVFGEITPKTFAQKYAVGFSRLVATPLLWLTYILFPIVWIFDKFIHGLMILLKAESPIRTMSEEELLAMVDIGTKEGVIEEQEQELIENVLEFTDTIVQEIMTNVHDIEAMECKSTIEDAAHFVVEHSHSRIPVYKGSINNIIGIVTVHDVLRLLHNPDDIQKLEDLQFAQVIVVPKTKSISKLFREFQKRRQHMAMVVDEHGKTVGLVTLEDILEEIVGEIVDEQDREDKGVFTVGKHSWEIDGNVTIEDINEELGLELDYPEHQTIGLLILEKLNRFPKDGEKITHQNVVIQVKEMSDNKIDKVIITKLTPPSEKEES